MSAPAWAPPGSILPDRLSSTPLVPEAVALGGHGAGCVMIPRPRLAGGNLQLPWAKGRREGVPQTLGSWASRNVIVLRVSALPDGVCTAPSYDVLVLCAK